MASTHPLEEILNPKSIAVVGASNSPTSAGYNFTHHLLDYGYRGGIYPVNPKYSEILGIKAYPSLKDIPGSVDYVISCIPAGEVLSMVEACSQKGVKAICLYTARFSETGRPEAAELEREILKQARKTGIRLIGPNCLGIYYPQAGLSFSYDFPKEPGKVGLACQSGGAANSFVYYAALRGILFSKVISYGNALDLNECDLLDYLAQDPETKVILMYIEGVRDGRRLLDSLRRAASTKPVIVLKGGRGESGARATASHTGSIAGSMPVWEAVVAQTGAISAQNLNEMMDLAVSFYFLPPVTGARVGVIGGGGGISVFSADECGEAGLDVVPLPVEIREELKSKAPSIWDWIGNPVDVTIMNDAAFGSSDILRMMVTNQNFDLIIGNITVGIAGGKQGITKRLENEVKGYIEIRKGKLKPLLVVVEEDSLGSDNYQNWRWELIREVRTQLVAAGVPLYPAIFRAARAARKIIDYYQKRG